MNVLFRDSWLSLGCLDLYLELLDYLWEWGLKLMGEKGRCRYFPIAVFVAIVIMIDLLKLLCSLF